METMSMPVQPGDRMKRPFRGRTVGMPLLFLVIHFSAQTVVQLLMLLYRLVLGGFRFGGFEDLMSTVLTGIVPMLIISSLVQISVYLIYLYLQTRDGKLPFGVCPRQARYIPGAATVTFTGLFLAGLIVQFFNWLGGQNEGVQRAMEAYNTRATNMMSDQLVLNILAIAILVPISEELLFRGIITGELRGVVPDWAAVLIGGAVFALAHGNLIQNTYVLPAGILFGLIYVWSDSILLSILMHMLYNLVGGIVMPALEENPAGKAISGVVVPVLALAGAATLVILALERRRQRQNAARTAAVGDGGPNAALD